MDERFVVHIETNGIHEVGYVLLNGSEAAQCLEVDRVSHESEGWAIHQAATEDPRLIVMTRGSSTRRVWLERHTAEPSPVEVGRDIRQLLARGFEYPSSIVP